MGEPILHHYWGSPYAEKIRPAFGYKNLTWRSCEIPVTPPRPSLEPILGAFRRTPVLQIGADYICDTRLILQALDALSPAPSLEKTENCAFSELLAGWAEPRVFALLGPVRFQTAADVDGIFKGQVELRTFSSDRMPFMHPVYTPERFSKLRNSSWDHLRRYMEILEMQLTASPFLGGSQASAGDFSAYHTIWWLRAAPAHPEFLAEFPFVAKWADRIAAFGYGQFTPISQEETLSVAKSFSSRDASFSPKWASRQDDRVGARVEIVADDYGRDPIEGFVVGMTDRHITIRRDIESIGAVRVHFPRLGYEIVTL